MNKPDLKLVTPVLPDKYEEGKTYRCETGETLKVVQVDDELATMRLVVGANGKIPEEELYIEGPAGNLDGFMRANKAVEVLSV